MVWTIFYHPFIWTPLFVINLGVIVGIGHHQYGRRYSVSCQTFVLSGLFAFIAILIALLIFPFGFVLEAFLGSFAMDAVLIMVWVLWKFVYKRGEQYL